MMTRRQTLTTAAAALLASQAPRALRGQSLKRKALLTQELPRLDAKDMTVSVVELEYEPGGTSAEHRHPGHAFVYVVEGALVSQLENGPAVTYTAGQMFYEPPMGLHAVSRNASEARPAKFLVFFLTEKGKPLTVPAK